LHTPLLIAEVGKKKMKNTQVLNLIGRKDTTFFNIKKFFEKNFLKKVYCLSSSVKLRLFC